MDEFSGYVLLEEGRLDHPASVRHAAVLADGRGLWAFDTSDRAELYGFGEVGRVFLGDVEQTAQVIPPPSQVRRRLENYGDETYVLIKPSVKPIEALRAIKDQVRSACIVAERIGEMYLLVEGTPDMPTFDGELWRSTVEQYHDARLASV